VNPPVFFGSAALILALLLAGVFVPERFDMIAQAVQDWIVRTFGWLYVAAVAGFLILAVGLALSPMGDVKLGPDHAEPEFSNVSWFAMLFSAGMGIGLMFFGVAEPLMHFSSPPVGEGGTVAAAREAMIITFFHWGLHAWAIYAIVGLALAYFGFRRGLPLTLRSALYPLIGERIHGGIGHAVDILAILGTLFGVATSLGFGVTQINAGLGYLLGWGESVPLQVVLIIVITAIATLSVVSGLDVGIRRLSELNIILAALLLVFVFVTGPTVFLLSATIQNTGAYFADLVYRTFNLYAYQPNDWIGGWTLFYWAWWIAWSPFVGMFIARISRGRTVRQFVIGVLLVPAGLTFLWFTVFGDTALSFVLAGNGREILTATQENSALALYALLHALPLSTAGSILATILVVTFFVTSSDSASLVIDTIAAGGVEDAPVWQRIFWAGLEGAAAAVLLLAGGLAALQTASITFALPFVLVMIVVSIGLWRGLRDDVRRRRGLAQAAMTQIGSTGISWRQRLASIVTFPSHAQVSRFLAEVVLPAMQTVAAELGSRGVEATVEPAEEQVALRVPQNGALDFEYAVHIRGFEAPAFALNQLADPDRAAHGYCRAEVHLKEGSQDYDVYGMTREQLVHDIVAHYERHMYTLQRAA
jgi:choline/glycine/proline betaine transport protein